MICNTIVCDDDLKKNVEDQLEEIKQVIEIETTVQLKTQIKEAQKIMKSMETIITMQLNHQRNIK